MGLTLFILGVLVGVAALVGATQGDPPDNRVGASTSPTDEPPHDARPRSSRDRPGVEDREFVRGLEIYLRSEQEIAEQFVQNPSLTQLLHETGPETPGTTQSTKDDGLTDNE